ncbi:hypothetical protein D0T90_09000 [Neisseria animalis]|uniref:Uncharacterized protein n=1 Tax=Neisseria animalis TaxID=492 RepID=A0A5P3MSK3_NEIAN|nr:hypothetical protein D0T90_09000 [Neisseria animalis]
MQILSRWAVGEQFIFIQNRNDTALPQALDDAEQCRIIFIFLERYFIGFENKKRPSANLHTVS